MWFFRRKTPPSPSHLYVWLMAGAVFLVKSLYILLTSMRGLASLTWLIDDSFIEMRIARNIALGSGFSLDGLHPTTGAPFFWIYLTSFNHLLLGKESAIRATLMESALFGALATVVVFFIALKLTEDRRVAWTSFLLSTFTANAFFNAMNGMDTAFFTLFVLLSLGAFLGVGKPARWSPLAWGCVTGLMVGITMMTRGDGLFLLIGLGAYKLYVWWAAPPHERREHGRFLLGMLLVSGICFSIFMGWQLMQTGSPFPGNQVGRRELALALHGFSFDRFSLLPYLKIVVWNIFQLEDLLTIATGGSLLGLVAFLSGSLQRRLRPLGVISGIYLGIFFLLLVGYQWYFANFHGLRYINPAAHILFIFIAQFLWQLPLEFWKRGTVVFLGLCIAGFATYKHYQMSSRLPWAPYVSYIGRADPEKNRIFWSTLDWMRDNLPPDTVVGIRDYGRASMFTDVRIQDLAGNVDPEVAFALDRGNLKDYLRQRNVQYLLIPSLEQRRDKLYQYLHTQMRLEPVAGAPKPPLLPSLYKIVWE